MKIILSILSLTMVLASCTPKADVVRVTKPFEVVKKYSIATLLDQFGHEITVYKVVDGKEGICYVSSSYKVSSISCFRTKGAE